MHESPKLKRNHDLNINTNNSGIQKNNLFNSSNHNSTPSKIGKNYVNENKNANSILFKKSSEKFINNFINTLDSTNPIKQLPKTNSNNKPMSVLEQKYENQRLKMLNKSKLNNMSEKSDLKKRVRSNSNEKDDRPLTNSKGLTNTSTNLSERLRIPKSQSALYISANNSLNNSKLKKSTMLNSSNPKLEVSKSLSSIRRYEGFNSGFVESSLRETVGQKLSKSKLLFKVNVNILKNSSGKI